LREVEAGEIVNFGLVQLALMPPLTFICSSICDVALEWVSARLWKRCRAGIDENNSGNGQVHAIVLLHQSRDVVRAASPKGDVAFHIIGTVVQQAS
jgi:hypothetical protein